MSTSSRSLSTWLGRSPSTASKISMASGTRSGWATQVPSQPPCASRSLSSRTFAKATSLTAASRREGMKAAMPPIAWAPRRWQARTSICVYARMKGTAIVTWERSGRIASSRSRSFLIAEKM